MSLFQRPLQTRLRCETFEPKYDQHFSKTEWPLTGLLKNPEMEGAKRAGGTKRIRRLHVRIDVSDLYTACAPLGDSVYYGVQLWLFCCRGRGELHGEISGGDYPFSSCSILHLYCGTIISIKKCAAQTLVQFSIPPPSAPCPSQFKPISDNHLCLQSVPQHLTCSTCGGWYYCADACSKQ